MKKIVILGSTGSVGTQTLDIVRNQKEIKVTALAAGSNIDLMEEQIREFSPKLVCIYDNDKAQVLRERIKDLSTKVVTGMEGLIECATLPESEMVVAAMVGMIGILPVIEAIKSKKHIVLANKETLVTAGHIIMPLSKQYQVELLTADSEHSAIFQALNGEDRRTVANLILTASGGPFRGKKISELTNITPKDALKHPNWSMGKKITIDSATLVNKGLEVMEARWLFDMPISKIKVVIHPQSVIHSMVEYIDGSVIAQLGVPDMRLPIQYALFYPERKILVGGEQLDFLSISKLTFEEPDMETFAGLRLAYEAGRIGGSMPTVYNAANEWAVARFLEGRIGFLSISLLIEEAMKAHKLITDPDLNQILETEKWAYEFARKWAKQ